MVLKVDKTVLGSPEHDSVTQMCEQLHRIGLQRLSAEVLLTYGFWGEAKLLTVLLGLCGNGRGQVTCEQAPRATRLHLPHLHLKKLVARAFDHF